MPKFSPISIIKRSTKTLARNQTIPLNKALESVATSSGFSDFHEMTAVAKKSSQESRLTKAAFGLSDLGSAVFEDEIDFALDSLLEEELSGAIAETNAYNFSLQSIDVGSTHYDEHVGILTLNAELEYCGDQDPDRPYHGTSFFIKAEIRLKWTSDGWELLEDEPLTIESCTTDADKDREAEMDWLYEESQRQN
ncbi:P-loop NTPase family protein [Marinobacter alexandrii]|uniref:hypothetical protein n=1 Tax=Marinobacter alexandrii TaxID=2570351 RepID=UPI001109D2FF|nr:hypothetical protein [Marinobacter alexandrii]